MKMRVSAISFLGVLMLSLCVTACNSEDVVDLTGRQEAELGRHFFKKLSLVKLRGKTNHFGMDITVNPPEFIDYDATVPDVKVWFAEYPFTKHFDITTDETGWWTMYVLKWKGKDLEVSMVYEKEGWITTKSNKIVITDEDNEDLAIHYIDPLFFNFAMKPLVENLIQMPLVNAMVVTVGKSWASLHDDRLPHGDPGAIALIDPVSTAIGPVYFNEQVVPDPTWTHTSVDGGVTWINVPLGEYQVTAEKPDFNYDTVTFDVTEADAANGVVLYIASPPDSVQGDNDSGPGEN